MRGWLCHLIHQNDRNEKTEILIKNIFQKKHEVPKGVIRNRNTKKDRQHNGQAKNGQKDVRCYSFCLFLLAILRIMITPLIKDGVFIITVGYPIFPSILIAKYLFTGSLKKKSIDNLETQKKYISMKNFQFFIYLLYAKSK